MKTRELSTKNDYFFLRYFLSPKKHTIPLIFYPKEPATAHSPYQGHAPSITWSAPEPHKILQAQEPEPQAEPA